MNTDYATLAFTSVALLAGLVSLCILIRNQFKSFRVGRTGGTGAPTTTNARDGLRSGRSGAPTTRARDALHAGDSVRLHGLVRSSRLNGRIGTLTVFDAASQRWCVIVRGVEGTVTIRALATNLNYVESDADKELRLARAAINSSVEVGCSICQESLSREEGGHAPLHRFSCGHTVHVTCWAAHTKVHVEIADARGIAGHGQAHAATRCPLCRAWDGERNGCWGGETWYDISAMKLLAGGLAFVYQSRWQAAGEDRSAAQETEFVVECFARAKRDGSSLTAIRTLDALLVACRANGSSLTAIRTLGDLWRVGPLLVQTTKAFCAAAAPFLRNSPGGVFDPEADAYDSHFRRWLATFLPLPELHEIDPRLFDA